MASQVTAGAHLGDETIAAMLEGKLADDGVRRARDHIAGCAECRRLVSAAIGADGNATASTTLGSPWRRTSPIAHTLREGIVSGFVIAGRYRIERVLGEGGMGRVFAARQIGLERPVALKILRPELARDGMALKRFQREARLVASLISEHVIGVHDLGELETGEPYLVMELLEGEDLATVLARGRVSVEQATAWILAACEALTEAHALGIVHRDIKPSNLFLTRQGRLKVLDFGLAKLAIPVSPGASMTGAGVMLGSPRYMAPEQIVGARDVDPRADIWSLGATLYHLVTGTPPFADQTLEAIFESILTGRQPSLDAVPLHIAPIIQRALARDPAARFATVGEFAAVLRAPSTTPAITPPAVTVRPRSRIAMALVIVVLAGSIGVVGFVAGRTSSTPPDPGSAGATPTVTLGANVIVADASRPTVIVPDAAPGLPPASPTTTGSATTPRSPASPVAVAPPTPGNLLGGLDEARLRGRLEKLGWTIKEVDRQDFPGCRHIRFSIEKPPVINANTWLLDCDSAITATNEAARLRRGFWKSWIVVDANKLLMIGLFEEAASKQLADAVLQP